MSAELARRVADRAAAVRGVARLGGGGLGAAATYAPGQRIDGVRVHQGSVEIHITAARTSQSLPMVAQAVRDAVRPLTDGLAIDAFVDDLDLDVIDLEALASAPPALDRPAVPGPRP